MRLRKTIYLIPFILSATVLLITGCSTQKNTASSRWWHSFNARYNTYYNGTLAYIDGSLEKESGNKDNYTEMIPLYTVGNKSSKELGKTNFEKSIEKCEKTIKLHSIKRRPEWNKNRKKTENDIEWLSRKEYNPFLWKAWLLMGRSQFYKGAFDEAAATFSYISRLYQSQPAIYGRAKAWLAKSYIEQNWIYDAEDVIRNMQRDSIHWRAQKEWDYTYADYYIHTGEYGKAIPYLRKVIGHEMRRKQKAREWFLMGQLETALNHKELATKAYKHVIRLNPPYEVEFNARIAMTEVMASNKSKQMISRLKRMAASDNNKEYLDQVYYAIGNIYLNQKDTLKAIYAYEKGNEKSTRNGIEKGVLLLKLGDIYWTKEKYSDAQRCYGEAIGLLDKERDDYKQLSSRSKILDELVPHTEAVHLQDSLQSLAKMSEKDRNAAIDRVIEAVKKKEKEERDKLAENNAQQVMIQNGASEARNQQNANQNANQASGNKSAMWYFYNQMAVIQGKTAFQKLWGKRENTDNWQRNNKTVVAGNKENGSETINDSLANNEINDDSLANLKDSVQNDPHKREYYLAQIPFTEEQVLNSNNIIADGLYNSGVIFKDKLENIPLSEKALLRLVNDYTFYEHMDDAFYHLFLLYSRKGMSNEANNYVERLKKEYPNSQWTTILTDPYFKENAKFGNHIEDSLYVATYDAFKGDRFKEVNANTKISESRFPLGANRDKFLFIGGLSKLNDGNANGCLADMKTIVEKFPESKLSEMAGMIVNGVNAGKRLHGGKFDIGDVWSRRSVVLNDSTKTKVKQFSTDRNANFIFMVAYQPDSINENQLLYELARYNFTSYMVRNFDISIEDADGLRRLVVTGFRNYDEALQYARQLNKQPNITKRFGKSRAIIISESNKELLGTQFSYDDYDKFYDKHFAPLKVNNSYLLSEPEAIATDKEDISPTPADNNVEGDNNDDIIINNDNTIIAPKTDNEIIIEDHPAVDNHTDGTIIMTEPETTPKKEKVTTHDNEYETETPSSKTDTGTIIPIETPKAATPQTKAKKTTTVKKVAKKPQATKTSSANIKTKTIEKKKDADEIYFDDEPVNNGNKKQEKKQDKKEEYDLEDEYYDLEGF